MLGTLGNILGLVEDFKKNTCSHEKWQMSFYSYEHIFFQLLYLVNVRSLELWNDFEHIYSWNKCNGKLLLGFN
jgi:hypothetical protein